MLLFGWFIGAVLFMIPIIRALLHVRSLRRYSLPWRYGQAVVEDLAPGTRRRVEVLLHESLPGPMTCGVLKPVIFLPVDARSWDKQDLERALVHEFEHVRRYDWAIHCLARVACGAYWFHPLVWTAWRQLTLEAERSCDDAVLRNAEGDRVRRQLVLDCPKTVHKTIAGARNGEPVRSGGANWSVAGPKTITRPGVSLSGSRLRRRRGDRADYGSAPSGCRAAIGEESDI